LINSPSSPIASTNKFEGIGVAEAPRGTLIHLAYAQTVYNVSPQALIITLGAESFDYCETLTPRAESALPEVLQYVLERIPKYS
jgi:coenzyme F420-reducing hydrogenase alpha subunit